MNSRPFLITGLPRSCTAWMAAYFSNFPAVCHHEPLKFLSDITELPAALTSHYYQFVGASDSGAGFFLPWIMEHMNPPTVIIDRDIEEVRKSMAEIGLPMGKGLDMLRERLLTFRDHPSVLWVPFESLGNRRIMQKIHFHLLPGVAFDEKRFESFSEMKIEANVEAVKKLAAERKEQQAHMMRDVLKEIESWPG